MELLERQSTNRVTLRLQNDVLEVLKRDAAQMDMTLNAFINKVLNKTILYEETVNAILNVVFPHDFFLSIMDKLKESDIEEISEKGSGVVQKLFNILGTQYDVDHVIHNYFTIVGKYCNWFEFSYKISHRKCRLVFCSDTNNQKWVLFLKLYIKSILESLQVVMVSESQHDGIIVFEFVYDS